MLCRLRREGELGHGIQHHPHREGRPDPAARLRRRGDHGRARRRERHLPPQGEHLQEAHQDRRQGRQDHRPRPEEHQRHVRERQEAGRPAGHPALRHRLHRGLHPQRRAARPGRARGSRRRSGAASRRRGGRRARLHRRGGDPPRRRAPRPSGGGRFDADLGAGEAADVPGRGHHAFAPAGVRRSGVESARARPRRPPRGRRRSSRRRPGPRQDADPGARSPDRSDGPAPARPRRSRQAGAARQDRGRHPPDRGQDGCGRRAGRAPRPRRAGLGRAQRGPRPRTAGDLPGRRLGQRDHGERAVRGLRRALRTPGAGAQGLQLAARGAGRDRADRRAARAPRGRELPAGRRAAARRVARERHHPAARAQRTGADHPQVQARTWSSPAGPAAARRLYSMYSQATSPPGSASSPSRTPRSCSSARSIGSSSNRGRRTSRARGR